MMEDLTTKSIVEMFAKDQDLFFEEYSKAHLIMSDLGR